MKKILSILIPILLIASPTYAQFIQQGPQGGTNIGSTGAGNIGNCLKVSSVGPLVWAIGACGGGGGSSGGSWSTTTSQVSGQFLNYPNNATDIVTIGSTSATSSAKFYFDPNLPLAFFNGPFLVSGSTTLQNFTARNATTSQATTTSFAITGLTSKIPYAFPDGDLGALTIGTGLSLTNGTLSNTGGSTFAWPFTKQTSGSQATSTVMEWIGGFLSDASSTLTTLNFTNATSTNLALTSLSPNALVASNSIGGLVSTSTIGNNQLQQSTISGISLGSNLNALTAGNGSITFSGSYNGNLARTVTLNVTNPNDWTGLQTFTNSTSTNFSSTIASTSQLTVSGQADGCAQFGNSGRLTSTGSACGSGGGTFAYPFQLAGNATSTKTQFNGGITAVATSTIGDGTAGGGLTINGNATSTGLGFHIGPVACKVGLSLIGGKGLEICEDDNVITSGSNLVLANNNSGTAAFADLLLLNDQADSAITKYAVINLNSSTFNNTLYGTGFNFPNLLQLQNTMGPVGIGATSGTSNDYVYFTTGGSALANERMRITSNGNIGIGTTTPYAQVQIASTTIPNLAFTSTSAGVGNKHLMESWDGSRFVWATSSDTAIGNPLGTSTDAMALTPGVSAQLGVGTTSPTFARLGVSSNDMSYTYQLAVGSSTKTDLLVDIAGHVFAPNTTTSGANQTGYWCYDGSGQLIRDTTVCLVSALKFKKNITDLSPSLGLAAVLQMKPITYYLKNPFGKEDAGEQIGFVADWSEKIVPDLVTHDSNGDVHGFNYEQYTAVLTKAIQELNTKIVSAKRSAEENWQWIAIGILALVVFKQGRDIKKLKS